MSTNIVIESRRVETFYRKDGSVGSKTNIEYFDVFQTSTIDTAAILADPDPMAAYIRYVLGQGEDLQSPIYDEDDWFGEGDPVGYLAVNEAKDHVSRLQSWVQHQDQEGFEIQIKCW